MGNRTQVGDTVRAACEQHPKIPNLMLARMLVRDHPMMFSGVDNARCAVRYYRGAMGEHNRKLGGVIPRELPAPLPAAEPEHFNPYTLPPALWGVIGDIHVPYHSTEALSVIVGFLRSRKVTGVLLDGDAQDCHEISTFDKDLRRRKYVEELDVMAEVLAWLKQQLRPSRFVWKGGNHEHRLRRFLMRRAPELLGLDDMFDFRSALNLDECGITWVEPHDRIYCGELNILHGHESGRGSTSVNAARTAYLRNGECCLVAHGHRSSLHPETTLRGTPVSCWSIGCACGLHPDYAPNNKWNWGFAIVDNRAGMWRVENYRIVSGEVMPC